MRLLCERYKDRNLLAAQQEYPRKGSLRPGFCESRVCPAL